MTETDHRVTKPVTENSRPRNSECHLQGPTSVWECPLVSTVPACWTCVLHGVMCVSDGQANVCTEIVTCAGSLLDYQTSRRTKPRIVHLQTETKQASKQTNKQTIKQAGRQTDRQTKTTYKQTSKLCSFWLLCASVYKDINYIYSSKFFFFFNVRLTLLNHLNLVKICTDVKANSSKTEQWAILR